MKNVIREITPLQPDQLYFAESLPDDRMDFPVHNHEEYELTLSACGHSYRTIGSTFSDISGLDLVMIGPGVTHSFRKKAGFENERADLTVVQFSHRLQEFKMFNTDVLKPISQMLGRTLTGIVFSPETVRKNADNIRRLPGTGGFDGVMLFLKILYDLATSPNQTYISAAPSIIETGPQYGNERVNRILNYIHAHYAERLSLERVGQLVNLSRTGVSRYFKAKTSHHFTDYVNSYRVHKATEMMLNTDKTVSEIAYTCGFNNLSNFNRIFKSVTKTTPSTYRKRLRVGGDGLPGIG